MKSRELLYSFATCALLVLPANHALGQNQGKFSWEETAERLKASSSIATLGHDLAGDKVTLSNGALSFSVLDLSVAGISGLPIELRRSYAAINRKELKTTEMFADWKLDTPTISGQFAPNWVSGGSDPTKRCSDGTGPGYSAGFHEGEYFTGLSIDLGGGGAEPLLRLTAPISPTNGNVHIWTTSDGMTQVSCTPTIANGTGEGFFAITPNGTKYWFTWMASHPRPMLKRAIMNTVTGFPAYDYLERRHRELHATRVEDRFGNWLTYSYGNSEGEPGRLTGISSSDGISISITYSGDRISSINFNERTWIYSYTPVAGGRTSLSRVTYPDGSSIEYDFSQLTTAEIKVGDILTPGEIVRTCLSNETPQNIQETPIGIVNHSSGATASFKTKLIEHGRNFVPVSCSNVTTTPSNAAPGTGNDPQDDVNRYDISSYSYTLIEKTISGPGIPSSTWNFSYSPNIGFHLYPGVTNGYPVCKANQNPCYTPPCLSDTCALSSATTVVAPDGSWTRYSHGNTFHYNEGKLLKVERGIGNQVLSIQQFGYDFSMANAAYPAQFGHGASDSSWQAEFHRPELFRRIQQDGQLFERRVKSFDYLARPIEVIEASSF
jgi:hypothetical protein